MAEQKPDSELPIDAPPESPALRESPVGPWILLASLIQLGILAFLCTGFLGTRGDLKGNCFIGAIFGLVSCAGIWSACGAAPPLWRIPAGITGAIMTWFTMQVAARPDMVPNFQLTTAILIGSHFLQIQLAVWIWSIWDPGRFAFIDAAGQPIPLQDPGTQFSLSQLMLATAIVAVLCAIGGLVVPSLKLDLVALPKQLISIGIKSLFVAVIGISQVLALSSVLSTRGAIQLALIVPVALTGMEVVLLQILSYPYGPPLWQTLMHLGLANSIHLAEIWITFGLLFVGGLRWFTERRLLAGESSE